MLWYIDLQSYETVNVAIQCTLSLSLSRYVVRCDALRISAICCFASIAEIHNMYYAQYDYVRTYYYTMGNPIVVRGISLTRLHSGAFTL